MSALQKYRPEIDGLRAIAVAIVVAFHAKFFGFDGGFVGVDVFFVISGFLITKLLVEEIKETGTIQLQQFYAKRFKRLYPSLIVVIVVCMLIWFLVFAGGYSDTRSFAKSVRYSIFGLANFFFSKNTGGYFDGASDEMPLLHFWSLAVEEQFYFFWTFFLLLIRKRMHLFLSLLVIASLVGAEFLLKLGYAQEAFYMMPARIWELGIGGILAINNKQLADLAKKTPSYLTEIFLSIGIAGILFCTFYFNEGTRFPGVTALIPVLGTAILIVFGEVSKGWKKVLSSKIFVRLGILSYGWYLWHWPLLAFLRIYYMGELPPIHYRIIAVILSLIFADLSLRYIEGPVRSGDYFKKMKAKKVIIVSLMVSFFVAGLSYVITNSEKYLESSFPKELLTLVEETSGFPATCNEISKENKEKCFVGNNKEKVDDLVYFWGDSHAYAYAPFLIETSKKLNFHAYLRSHSALVPFLGQENLIITNQKVPYPIRSYNDIVRDEIANSIKDSSIKRVSVVLVARWPSYIGEKAISVRDGRVYLDKSKTSDGTVKEFKVGLEKTLNELKRIGIYKVIILNSIPEFKYEIKRCIDINRCITSKKTFDSYRQSSLQAIEEISTKFSNVRIIDPAPSFCDAEVCPQLITVDGRIIPVVYDDDHISVSAGKYLAQQLEEKIKWIVE